MYLEHFDLTTGDVQSFWSAVSVTMGVGFNLDAEGNTFFASVLLWRKFRTDAVDFDVNANFFGRIPNEFDYIEVVVVLEDIVNAVG